MTNANNQKYNMTYKEIAETLTKDEGKYVSEYEVKQIALGALGKLRRSGKLQDLYDYLEDM